MEIKIKKMNDGDLLSLENTLLEDFDNFWNYNILIQEFLNNSSQLFVAKNSKNEIVGFAGIQFILDEANITNIVTKKTERKKGIGTSLLNYIIKYSKNNKMNSITLEVNENNLNAISLYSKFNFKNVGLRKNYYNGCENAIIMTLYF